FLGYVAALAPTGAVLLGVLLVACRFAFPTTRLELHETAVAQPVTNTPLLAGSVILLAAMVAALQWGFAIPAALIFVAVGILFFRRVLAGVDWLLLVTFAAMFVGLGHLAALPFVQAHVGALAWHDPRVTYAGGIVLSQIISNVPAAVALQHYAPNLTLLAAAVNVGGSGLMIGSLANLIALRLDGGRGCPAVNRHPSLHRHHDVLIWRPGPHHVWRARIRISALRIQIVEALVGTDDHHVRSGLDPVIARCRFRRVWIGVAGIGAALKHIHETDLAACRGLVAHPRTGPRERILVHAHRVGPRRCRRIGHASPAIAAFAQGAHLASGAHRHDGGVLRHSRRRGAFSAGDQLRVAGGAGFCCGRLRRCRHGHCEGNDTVPAH